MLNFNKEASRKNAGLNGTLLINKIKKGLLLTLVGTMLVTSLNTSVYAAVNVEDVTPQAYENQLSDEVSVSKKAIDYIHDIYEDDFNKLYSTTVAGVKLNYYESKDQAELQAMFKERFPNSSKTIDDYQLSEAEFNEYISYLFRDELLEMFPSFYAEGITEINIMDYISYPVDHSYDAMSYSEPAMIELPIFVVETNGNNKQMTAYNNIRYDIEKLRKGKNANAPSLTALDHEMGHLMKFYYDKIYKKAYPSTASGYFEYRGIENADSVYRQHGGYFKQAEEIAAEDYLEILDLVLKTSKYYSRSGSKNLAVINGTENEPNYYDDSQDNRMLNFYLAIEEYIKTVDKDVLLTAERNYEYDPFDLSLEEHFTKAFEDKMDQLPYVEKSVVFEISSNYKKVVECNNNQTDEISMIVAIPAGDSYVLIEQDMFEYVEQARQATSPANLLSVVVGFRDGNGKIHKNFASYNAYNFFITDYGKNETFITNGFTEEQELQFNEMREIASKELVGDISSTLLNSLTKEELKDDELVSVAIDPVVDTNTNKKYTDAEALQICVELGMIKGTGGVVEDSYGETTVSRVQLAVMLLRLMGKEEEAKNYSGDNFTDGSDVAWAENILSYVHDHNIGFGGYPDGSFNPEGKVTGQAALKVILTLLGYDNEDFTWNETQTFANSKNMVSMDTSYSSDVIMNDMAQLTIEALNSNLKDQNITLSESLGINLDMIGLNDVKIGQEEADITELIINGFKSQTGRDYDSGEHKLIVSSNNHDDSSLSPMSLSQYINYLKELNPKSILECFTSVIGYVDGNSDLIICEPGKPVVNFQLILSLLLKDSPIENDVLSSEDTMRSYYELITSKDSQIKNICLSAVNNKNKGSKSL